MRVSALKVEQRHSKNSVVENNKHLLFFMSLCLMGIYPPLTIRIALDRLYNIHLLKNRL